MMPQPVTNENIVIVTSNSIGFPHTEKPKPTNQSQDILKKYLKAELKVWGVRPIPNVLEWDLEGATGKKLGMSWDWRVLPEGSTLI